MVHTCSRCSRANPSEAQYCYHDGAALMSGIGSAGPVAVGRQPFPQQFVFPNGRACRNFDQLALACQENWQESLEVLRQGYLEGFLGRLGRSDLAKAARDAAHFPDHDRGLDQFLAQLPSDVVLPPKLAAEPTVINLGQLKPGEDRRLEIHLQNQGMRLLQGSVSSDSVWLSVGDGPGTSQKLFQFGKELTIAVHVRGQNLRASNKPLQGKLLIESNAGSVEVVIQGEVPVRPFPDGIFAGARSPRQVAEKAKGNPKEAAKLFENGAVARWYQDNGWTYPVQGPTASGLAAVQQFFEALGLTPPPKVEIRPQTVELAGEPGGQVHQTIEVHTTEKRPVYAHATSDQDWLTVHPPRLSGRSASITFSVNPIPGGPGDTLTASLRIRSNGNQRFVVPVKLTIGGRAGTHAPAPTAPPPRAETFTFDATPSPAGTPPITLATKHKPERTYLIPAVLLAAALFGVVVWDVLSPLPSGTPIILDPEDVDNEPRIGVSFRPDNDRVGIVLLKERDPQNRDALKRLTFSERGDTGNVCIMVDGQENLYGQTPGAWVKKPRMVEPGRKWTSTWRYAENVYVTQTVSIVRNDATRLLDTCLVHYVVENNDTVPHNAGLRVMLDTFIGSNDAVPFAIPGQPGLMNTMIDSANTKDIPDFVQALERPNLADPGTTAHLGIKLPSDVGLGGPALEPVHRFVICRWPGNPEIRWQFPAAVMAGDSCVLLYWDYRRMQAGEKRAMAFSYGLGMVGGDADRSSLALTYGPSRLTIGDVFTITAYVKNPGASQGVTLRLPPGMTLHGRSPATQTLGPAAGGISQVSWKVAIAANAEASDYSLRVETLGKVQRLKVRVHTRDLFSR